jgi:hypothetical protein
VTAISLELRQRVAQRAAHRCEYCQLPQACQVATFPVDHIVPRSQGGKTELSNLALACPRCNALKWVHTVGRDPATGEQVEVFNPRRHVWSDHFAWSSTEPDRIQSQTAIGRATLWLLEFNAPRRLEIRRWLASVGLHPPE